MNEQAFRVSVPTKVFLLAIAGVLVMVTGLHVAEKAVAPIVFQFVVNESLKTPDLITSGSVALALSLQFLTVFLWAGLAYLVAAKTCHLSRHLVALATFNPISVLAGIEVYRHLGNWGWASFAPTFVLQLTMCVGLPVSLIILTKVTEKLRTAN